MTTPSHPPRYPRDFLWGVATAAYQIEGGLNGPGQPLNNWARFEGRDGRDATGVGVDFWRRYRDDLARAAALGLDAFRMGIEWARVEPRAGEIDATALDRYADIIATIGALGMTPIVTLHHFSHPAWLGPDPWLDRDVPHRFARYAGVVTRALGRRLVERGVAPVVRWVTINEPNALCNATYLLGAFPRGRGRGRRDLAAALAGVLAGHVFARRALHEAHDAERWAPPIVTFNAWAASVYDVDRLLVDLCRPHTRHHIEELRRELHRAVPPGGLIGRLARWALRRRVPRAAFAPIVAELGRDEDALDALGIDYYHPFLGDYLGWRGPKRHPWQWPFEPRRMPDFLAAWVAPHSDLRLYILESGLATRALGGTRPDGLDRPRALRDTFAALDACLARGVPLAGYLHWSLTDNYEWGSFEPRFGLYGIDYDRDAARLPHDASGADAAGTFAALIAERRAADHTRAESLHALAARARAGR